MQEDVDVLKIDEDEDGPHCQSSAADDPIVCDNMRSQAQYLTPQLIATGDFAATIAPSPPPAPLH
ncbi:hypothetical protein BC835DRAFT_1419921 [Cytidiella melzeri]|nr:hypothetical protein BC835DRAFT_1419921 [Cytidiella melzeri]